MPRQQPYARTTCSDRFSAGPEAKDHLDGIREFVDAGFDEVAVVQVGDDHQGFLERWQKEMRPELP
jgi:coenzyme F420-dependent glucose-6-phosphate dehydrogenase